MFYSVCIPAILGGKEISRALEIVRTAGYDHYEFWSWTETEIEQYYQAQKREHLSAAGMCTLGGTLNDPSQHADYLEKLKETAKACKKLNCKKIITQVGMDIPTIPREIQHANIVTGLRACIPVLEEYDLVLMIEALNTRIDHVGYYLWSAQEAFQIIEEVGNEHVKVIYDMYHQYVMNDLDLDHILKNLDKIAHFHMAGYPGRNEPWINSEIDYQPILEALKSHGYQGGIGLEYLPLQDALEGLKFERRFLL